MLEVDSVGLDNNDVRYLKALIQKHGGGPVGVETIASTISEDIGTIEEVVEPYLLQIGFIKKTPKGRVATKVAFEHFGLQFGEEKKGKSHQKLI